MGGAPGDGWSLCYQEKTYWLKYLSFHRKDDCFEFLVIHQRRDVI